MKKKSKKRKRLEPLARIRRRLMRLWTAKVAEEWGHKCAVCGSENLPNAHHLENRNTCRALRYDPMNGVLLCPSHHKWGKDSAHKGGIWFADWLLQHYPDRFRYVLAHRNDDINLNDRTVLAGLEAKLAPAAVAENATTTPGAVVSKMETPTLPDSNTVTHNEETKTDEGNTADNG